MPTAPVAAGSLLLGFAVAQATGVRPLGGVVLLAAVAWCAVRWRAEAGTPAAVALVALYAAAFAASHVLADALGTWGAVVTVAAAVGTAAWVVADRPRALPHGRRA
jgi:thiol:disulfide interchange protein